MSIPAEADLPDDEAQRRLVWPGPAVLMPAGLLPDGQPHSASDLDNAERITGRRPRNTAEADGVVVAYFRQQSALRAAAGLGPARRDRSGHLVETPAALAAIRERHRQERARRRLVETPPEIAGFLDRLAGVWSRPRRRCCVCTAIARHRRCIWCARTWTRRMPGC